MKRINHLTKFGTSVANHATIYCGDGELLRYIPNYRQTVLMLPLLKFQPAILRYLTLKPKHGA